MQVEHRIHCLMKSSLCFLCPSCSFAAVQSMQTTPGQSVQLNTLSLFAQKLKQSINWLSNRDVVKMLSHQSVVRANCCQNKLLPSQVLAGAGPIHLWRSLTTAALVSSTLFQDANEQCCHCKACHVKLFACSPSSGVHGLLFSK